jgi:excisionase family DNA binding protein
MDHEAEWMTAQELATRLRVTPETVRAWGRLGRIPALRLSPKVVRYNARAVFAALASGQSKGVSHGK